MTRVADDKEVSRDTLGDLAVQQWELFRRVKEGTLDPATLQIALKILTFGGHAIGVSPSKYDGCKLRIHRSLLQTLAKIVRADGSKVLARRFTNEEHARAYAEDKAIFDVTDVRPATWAEAVDFVATREPKKETREKWGVLVVPHGNWLVSFEEWESEITVVAAENNWQFQFMSNWQNNEVAVFAVKK